MDKRKNGTGIRLMSVTGCVRRATEDQMRVMVGFPPAILGNYMESGWFICIAIYSGCIEIVNWKVG